MPLGRFASTWFVDVAIECENARDVSARVINARSAALLLVSSYLELKKEATKRAATQLLRAEDKWIPGVPIAVEETLNNN